MKYAIWLEEKNYKLSNAFARHLICVKIPVWFLTGWLIICVHYAEYIVNWARLRFLTLNCFTSCSRMISSVNLLTSLGLDRSSFSRCRCRLSANLFLIIVSTCSLRFFSIKLSVQKNHIIIHMTCKYKNRSFIKNK